MDKKDIKPKTKITCDHVHKRTLGVYILFACLYEVITSSTSSPPPPPILSHRHPQDPLFIADCASSLTAMMQDNAASVRIRACWSIANLCDALLRLFRANATTTLADVSESGVPDITRCSIRACSDKYVTTCCKKYHLRHVRNNLIIYFSSDKVKANAVRALGNLGGIASQGN